MIKLLYNSMIMDTFYKERLEWWNLLKEEWQELFRQIFDIESVPKQEDFDKLFQAEEFYYNLGGSSDDDLPAVNSLEPLEKLTNLKFLTFKQANVETFQPLRNLKKLVQLDVEENPATDIEYLAELTNLEELAIWGDFASLKPLSSLTKLSTLICDGSVKNPQELQLFPKLKILSCGYTDTILDLSFVKVMENLESLSVRVSSLSDISELTNIHKLKELDIYKSKVTDLGPLSKLPLTFLNIQDTPVENLTPLQNLSTLEELNMNFTNVKTLDALRNLHKLKKLITGPGIMDLQSLKSLSQLEYLQINIDATLENFEIVNGLQSLKTLIWYNSHLSEEKKTLFKTNHLNCKSNFF